MSAAESINALPAGWCAAFDDDTQTPYYYNEESGESVWELPLSPSSSQLAVTEVENEVDWFEEVLRDLTVAASVSQAIGSSSSKQVWPIACDGQPSKLIRWNILKAEHPYREIFTTEDVLSCDEEFQPSLCCYAYAAPVPHTQEYAILTAEAPVRNRATCLRHTFARDVTEWSKQQQQQRSVQAIHAYPVAVHGAQAHHVEWSSGPDRYRVSTDREPMWGWTRQFSFYAYAASKYHVLECKSPQSYRLVRGHTLRVEAGWYCLMSFYAFDAPVPGAVRMVAQQLQQPITRTRIGMEPSTQWDDHLEFYVFDIPVPDTARYSVQYTIRSTESLDASPEQSRIYCKDPRGCWDHKMTFYAYPAKAVLLE